MTDTSDSTEEHTDSFRWISSGGCERCDALDGRLSGGESPRPHPNCTCVIERVWPGGQPCNDDDIRYTVDHVQSVHHRDSHEFDLVYAYEITCPDGAVLAGEVLVEQEYADWDNLDNAEYQMVGALMEALTMVEEIGATNCASCEPPHIV